MLFIQNKDCSWFPCHDIDEDRHDCKFCYCPLFFADCNGNYSLTDEGIKDCTDCLKPHIDKKFIFKEIRRLESEKTT